MHSDVAFPGLPRSERVMTVLVLPSLTFTKFKDPFTGGMARVQLSMLLDTKIVNDRCVSIYARSIPSWTNG